MKYKSILAAAVLGALTLSTSGCIDEFAKENTNPSAITKADMRYLFTQALAEFEPSKYQQWFYNNLAYTMPWAQSVLASETGNTSTLNLVDAYEGGQSQVVKVKLYTEEMKYTLSLMPAEEQERYRHIMAMCDPLLVYLGIFGTDMYGSMAYTEAGRGLHEELLTPKYETQKELFKLWDKQLSDATAVLESDLPDQVTLGKQDFVYGGSAKKWAKFANSLRLKIAVRLLHADKNEAIRIAKDVLSKSVMEGMDDDFFYCKGSQEYHFGDDVLDGQGRGIGSEQLVDLLIKNKDPRVRFIFQKNDFNSEVVQAFFDADANRGEGEAEYKVPEYILRNVDYEEVTDPETQKKKKVFKGWKAPGEPWVRYYGAPVSTVARENGSIFEKYFDSSKFKLPTKDGQKSYMPLARVNREMLQGQKDYTYPAGPMVTSPKNDNQDNGWYGLFYSTAEVNLYLAELGLIDPTLGIDVDQKYSDAVKLSVEEYDYLAKMNKVPYYFDKYDSNEKLIALEEGETAALLGQSDYTLSGDTKDKLEKVYIQQYIHFMLQPQEQFVQVRRSGVPMRNSSILKWEDFGGAMTDANYIPRRWKIDSPSPTDQMYDIKMGAYKEEGFTIGTNAPQTLNRERVWYDQGAPNFGEGPNF